MATITCPKCGRENAADAEVCAHCREPLTSVARVMSRHIGESSPRWLEQTRTQATDLKRKESAASNERMEALLEVDRRRKLAEAQDYARQQARDRQLIQIGVILIGVFVVVIVAAAVASQVLR